MNTDYYVFERDVKSLTLTLNKYFTNMIDSFEKGNRKKKIKSVWWFLDLCLFA